MGARGLLYRRILLWPQGTRPVHNAQLFRVLLNMCRLAAKVVEARAGQNDHAVECRVRSVQGSSEVLTGGRIRRLTLSGRGLSNAVKRNTRRSGNLGSTVILGFRACEHVSDNHVIVLLELFKGNIASTSSTLSVQGTSQYRCSELGHVHPAIYNVHARLCKSGQRLSQCKPPLPNAPRLLARH